MLCCEHMSKTKIVIALVAVAALTLVLVGLASAQIAANQTYIGTSADPSTPTPNNGFWGWIGNCFGYGANQAYGNGYAAPQAPTDGSTPAPNQSGYGYGYGYGPCWAR